MEVSHYKISNIDVNSSKVELYDTLTKKGTFVLASELYQQDRMDLFSEADQRIIARFLIATSIGTMVDSLIFCFGVFLFVVPIQTILIVVMTQYVIKLSYDIVVCTFSSKVAIYIKHLEKTDIVELPSNKITNIVGFKIDSDRCVNSYTNH